MQEPFQDYKIITFQINDQEYAIPITLVRSIVNAQSVTRVPFVPSYIKGIIHLRGGMIPITDVSEKFHLPLREITNQSRIILVTIDDIEVGILVDMVNDVSYLTPSAVKSPSAQQEYLHAEWVSGITLIGSRLVTLLDVEKIIKSDMSQHRNEGKKYVVH